MIIIENKRYNIITRVDTIDQLEVYIIDKKLIGNFIKFPDNIKSDICKKIDSQIEPITKRKLRTVLLHDFYKFKSNWTKEYWLNRGYSMEETVDKISKMQSKNANKYVAKRSTNPEKYNSNYPNQLKYWLKHGYSRVEAKEKVKEVQSTFSLKKCVIKYGEVEGIKRFNARNKKWLDTLNNKSPEEKQRINLARYVPMGKASKQSLECFADAINLLNKNDILYYIGAYGKSEYFLKKPNSTKIYFYDLTIPELNLIVELKDLNGIIKKIKMTGIYYSGMVIIGSAQVYNNEIRRR